MAVSKKVENNTKPVTQRKPSSTTSTDEKKEVEKKVEPKIEKYNPEKKVTVRSIANWTTGFQRIESNGDVTIPANGSVRLLASEIITQVQNGNLLFTGIDGQGAHATLYIEDKPTRIETDFETETTNQIVICEEVVKNLFAKNKKDFELELMKLIKTRAEEFAIIGIIRNLKINDYEKVRAVENLTGLRV